MGSEIPFDFNSDCVLTVGLHFLARPFPISFVDCTTRRYLRLCSSISDAGLFLTSESPGRNTVDYPLCFFFGDRRQRPFSFLSIDRPPDSAG